MLYYGYCLQPSTKQIWIICELLETDLENRLNIARLEPKNFPLFLRVRIARGTLPFTCPLFDVYRNRGRNELAP
jgi:hypothetical protein